MKKRLGSTAMPQTRKKRKMNNEEEKDDKEEDEEPTLEDATDLLAQTDPK